MASSFNPPGLIDVENQEHARLLDRILIVTMLATTVAQIVYFVIDPEHFLRYLLVIVVMDTSGFFLRFILHKGYTRQASAGLILIAWILVSGLAFTDGGIRAPETTAFFMVVFFSGFVLGERLGALAGLVCILTMLIFVVAEEYGVLPVPTVNQSSLSVWIIYSIFTMIIIGLQFFTARTIHASYNRARIELDEKRRAEAALRESEERFQLILRDSPIFVSMMDKSLRYTWVYNPPPGLQAGEILGKTDETLWQAEEARELSSFKREVIEKNSPNRKIFGLENGGGRFFYDISAHPILDRAGKAAGLMVVAVDITERKALEDQHLRSQVQLELRHRLLESQEKDRVRIARDLHDGPVQGLTAAALELQGLLMDLKDSQISSQLAPIKELIQEQIGQLRDFAGMLRPPSLDKFGLEMSIRMDIEDIQSKSPGMAIQMESNLGETSLETDIQLPVYRIYQEAMRNILHHSGATEVAIHIRKTPEFIEMEIRDNGVGFDLPKEWVDLARAGHLGLVGIQERAEAIGGTVEIKSKMGKGTCLNVKIPLRPPPSITDSDLAIGDSHPE